MKHYDLTASCDDDLWTAVVGGLGQGVVGAMDYEKFADLHAEIPGFIADLTDSEPGQFAINWH